MKEVFMPSMDDLYQMQDRGANVYKYILVKAIESIICNGLNYPNKGMLENAPKYLRENPEIARAICTLYPDEMIYSEIARNDVELAVRLMDYKGYQGNGLDYLCRFDSSVLSNTYVLSSAILKLESELFSNPNYRFEYVGKEVIYSNKGAGRLLDKIFCCDINNEDLMIVLRNIRGEVVKSLIKIEPYYALKVDEKYFDINNSNVDMVRSECLRRGINTYAERYGISMDAGSEYYRKDILTNPDTDVKRLIKCINDRR